MASSNPTVFSAARVREFLTLDLLTVAPAITTSRLYNLNGALYFDGVNLESGGGGSASMNEAYENGRVVTVDVGPVVWNDATDAAANTMEFNKTGAGSGNVLDFDLTAAFTGNVLNLDMGSGVAAVGIVIDSEGGARTGNDIQITDDSTGNHNALAVIKSGAGASVGYNYTESFNGNSASFGAKITLDDADGVDTTAVQIVRGTGLRTVPAIDINDASTGSAPIFDVDLTGVFTGNVLDFAASAAATGNVIFANLDTAVAMTALHIEGSGVRTQPMVEIATDATGSANLVTFVITGAISGNVLDFQMDTTSTGNVIDIDMNAAVGAKAIFIDGGAAIRTAVLIDILHDGSGNADCININESNTGSAPLIDINISGVGSGNVLDITYSAADTGDAISIVMADNVAGSALVITGAGARTDDFIKIDDSSTSNAMMFDINVSGNSTGNVLDIVFSGSSVAGDAIHVDMGTNVAGNAIQIDAAGARTAPLINIQNTGTDGGTDDHVLLINQTGLLDSAMVQLTFATAASTGDALSVAMGTNVAGMAIAVTSAATGVSDEGAVLNASHTGDLVAGADLVRISSTGSISASSNLVSLVQATGAGVAGANALHINASGANVEAIEIEAGILFEATVTANGAGNGETLSVAANISFYDPNGASRTGVILAAGLRDGQRLHVVNFADAAESITFAAAGTSRVSNGASCVIGQFEGLSFVWHAGTSLWYPLTAVFA